MPSQRATETRCWTREALEAETKQELVQRKEQADR